MLPTNHQRLIAGLFCTILIASVGAYSSRANNDAPAWVHTAANAPVPEHDEKAVAAVLYSEDVLTVQNIGKLKRIERRVYKILRPEGRVLGSVRADMSSETRVVSMHGWCIPTQGKDYEVKDKDAIETSLTGLENGELVSDVKSKILRIPAADTGNVIAYEIEFELQPYVLQDFWSIQSDLPVREAHYTLQLAPGWEYRSAWLNHAEIAPTAVGDRQFQWVVTDVKAIRHEERMPPYESVAAFMAISLFPENGKNAGFKDWNSMARWEDNLASGRRDASPEIKQKVAQLTAAASTPLAKMNALATFMQREIRYVAIQLGIGGWQPHPAADVFAHRYGDCKDKATLLSAMLHEIGIESYYLDVNTQRGVITPNTPATRWFDHVILAIKLPEGVADSSLKMVIDHPKLGKLLIFDPTDEYTPLGELSGELQASYALLVTPDGGELIKVPQLPTTTNGIQRVGKLSLTPSGVLTGDITDTRVGDFAAEMRATLKSATKESDKVKPLETMLSQSLPNFALTKATITNLHEQSLPFGFQFTFVAAGYAKSAGNLLLLRPRVIGTKATGLLETKEPRQFPVIFEGPRRDTDEIEIQLPQGYEVDDLPPPVDLDYSFASYHSKTEAVGNTLRYTRTFEIKELNVPMNKIDDLRKFYRVIGGDERNNAVLKPKS
ncbi:MAG TPA: DUF3857 domain-containing protein [Candidatus Acidoferrum sp.]|nr:DUF3857 domain-containing protein [Candidatus Acidoferrum sp.]